MSKKFSQFTEKETIADSDFINVTGSGVNRRITWPNFLDQVYHRIVTPFIYPTIVALQAAPLRADEDDPVYVRVEETQYRLYKITNLAPGVDDITLDNGNTASVQIEYRDIGFVIGPDTSTPNALAVYADATGTELADGPLPTEIGLNLIELPDSASDGYLRKLANNTPEVVSGAQLKVNLSLNNVDNTSDANKPISTATQAALDLKAPLASPALTGNPTAPTPAANDNDTSIATTAYVQGELTDRIQSVATIAAASALTGLVAGQVINVREYANGSGTGSGDLVFIVGSESPDTGTIFASATAGGYLRRLDSGPILLDWFRTGAADDTSALLACLNFANGRQIIGSGATINLDSALTYTGASVDLRDVTLDMSGGGTILLQSALSNLPFLDGNITAGSNLVAFLSAHGLAVGDVFVVHNPTNFSFAPFRDYYRDGEMFRVAVVVSSTSVRVYGTPTASYTSGDVNVYKINGGPVNIESVSIIPPASGIPLWIDGYHGVSLQNVTAENGAADTAIEAFRCYDIKVSGMTSSADAGDAYPIVLANCQEAIIYGVKNYSSRHAVALGGRSGNGTVPTRNILISDCILNNDSSIGIGSSDIHGNCANVTYNNCYLNSAANMSGRDAAYRNCTIVCRDVVEFPDGNCIAGSEISGGVYLIENCTLKTFGDSTAFGLIDLGVDKITHDFKLIINNLTIESNNVSGSDINIVRLFVGDSSPTASSIDVRINGVNFIGSDAFALLSVAGSNDVSGVLSLSVENYNIPDGTLIMAASNADNYDAPMKIQNQSLFHDASIASGTFDLISSALPLRNPLPRNPNSISICTGPVAGSAQSPYASGVWFSADVYAYTASTISYVIGSAPGSNFSSSITRRVFMSVGIDDL